MTLSVGISRIAIGFSHNFKRNTYSLLKALGEKVNRTTHYNITEEESLTLFWGVLLFPLHEWCFFSSIYFCFSICHNGFKL